MNKCYHIWLRVGDGAQLRLPLCYPTNGYTRTTVAIFESLSGGACCRIASEVNCVGGRKIHPYDVATFNRLRARDWYAAATEVGYNANLTMLDKDKGVGNDATN